MKSIKYKKGYKYQIVEKYEVETQIIPLSPIKSPYISLSKKGKISLKKGYAWDGPSGPTIDTKSFMRGSLVHDAFYQLMREGYLDKKEYRKSSDKLLKKMCREDGMNAIRASYVYAGVRMFANPAADPSSKKPVIEAP